MIGANISNQQVSRKKSFLNTLQGHGIGDIFLLAFENIFNLTYLGGETVPRYILFYNLLVIHSNFIKYGELS